MIEPIRLLIVAETRLYREGLVRLLGSLRRLHVAAATATLDEALDAMTTVAPIDVALVDMGVVGAPRGIEEILRISPETRIVAMAIHRLPDDVVAAATAGATGYLTRDASKEELIDTLYRAALGEVTCSSSIVSILVRMAAQRPADWGSPQGLPLTARERQIVELIAQGLSNKEIARRLYIALPTVKNHVHNILEKLDVSRRLDAARWLHTGMPRMGERFSF
jgi:two-component system nitrate/nitrite response regulator NarL